jgi:hypothetical protein
MTQHQQPDRQEFRQVTPYLPSCFHCDPDHVHPCHWSLHRSVAPNQVIVGGYVQDSMTFRALSSQAQCELCAANPAVLEFDILSDRESSRQRDCCCPTCARNLLDALSQIKPQFPKRNSAQSRPVMAFDQLMTKRYQGM